MPFEEEQIEEEVVKGDVWNVPLFSQFIVCTLSRLNENVCEDASHNLACANSLVWSVS